MFYHLNILQGVSADGLACKRHLHQPGYYWHHFLALDNVLSPVTHTHAITHIQVDTIISTFLSSSRTVSVDSWFTAVLTSISP